MDEENLEQNEQEQDEKKELGDYLFSWKRKFDNFWYHYKIAIIIFLIIFIFVIFCVAHCAAKVKGDADIAYIGLQEIDTEMYEDLQNALNDILGEDLNGDGKIHVDFTHFQYMTDVQMENARAQGQAVDYQSLLTVQTQISLELAAGNIMLYFISPEAYKVFFSGENWLIPLEDILGYTPDNAYDVYTLKLGSLPCWKYYMGLDNFPSNTLIALRDLQLSEEDDEKMVGRYNRNLKMFRNIVNFKYIAEENEEDIENIEEETND